MDIRKSRTCERCKAVVPLEKVRLFPKDQERNILVCETCVEELKHLQRFQKPPISNTRTSALPLAEFSTYACIRCNYSFRVDTAKAGISYTLHCPYCGKSDRLTKQIPAQIRI